jgi:hypothetical protein
VHAPNDSPNTSFDVQSSPVAAGPYSSPRSKLRFLSNNKYSVFLSHDPRNQREFEEYHESAKIGQKIAKFINFSFLQTEEMNPKSNARNSFTLFALILSYDPLLTII